MVVKVESLYWGMPCKKHMHMKTDGTNLRQRTRMNCCVSCYPQFINSGLTQEEMFIELTTPQPKVPKRTPEEIAKLRSAASMRWQAKNKEKVAGYQKTYTEKPETKARASKKSSEKYFSLEPEERKRRAREQYENRLERLGLLTEEDRAAYKEQEKQKRRDRDNAKYAILSDEEKNAIFDKQAAYREKKRLKNIQEKLKLFRQQLTDEQQLDLFEAKIDLLNKITKEMK